MFLELICKIKIGSATFNGVNKVEIKKSIHVLQDTALIHLPLSAVVKGNKDVIGVQNVADYIKKGDAVEIELGYNEYGLNKEFKGFVSKINKATLLEIEVEDEHYPLRAKKIKKSWKEIKLKSLISELITGTKLEIGKVADTTLNNIQINDLSAIAVLQKIMDHYGLAIYLNNGGKIYAGLKYMSEDLYAKYEIGTNIIKMDDLKFSNKDEVRYSVKVVNFKKDGKKEEYKFGEGEEKRTIHLYGLVDKKEMEVKAMAELERIKYSGFRGSFETFLVPFVAPNYVAKIKDLKYPERSGNYYVSSVETTFGTSGAKRKIEIDFKI